MVVHIHFWGVGRIFGCFPFFPRILFYFPTDPRVWVGFSCFMRRPEVNIERQRMALRTKRPFLVIGCGLSLDLQFSPEKSVKYFTHLLQSSSLTQKQPRNLPDLIAGPRHKSRKSREFPPELISHPENNKILEFPNLFLPKQ